MDWMIIVAAVAVVTAGYTTIRYVRLRAQVRQFTAQMEESLDQILEGKSLPEAVMEDTLFARLQEKLMRTGHIFELKKKENLEEKLQLQSLISDISHQSRIPLASQNVYLELLREEKCPEERRELLESLQHQTSRLQFLMESMIKLSRMETGIIQISKEEADVTETIRQALTASVAPATRKQISLYMKQNQPVMVSHDSRWTAEAVGNLLENAIKYTPADGSIFIGVQQQELFTVIAVSDTGKGIKKERQAEIFQRFYREPEVHDTEGIGIGLYLTRKIMERQDGYVDVVSEPEKGSTFRLYLPNIRAVV